MCRLIVLTRGTGQGTTTWDVTVCVRAAMRTTSRAPGRLWPENSRRLWHNRVASPSSRIQHLATTSSASQVGSIFGEKTCLSPPDELPTSCSLPPPKGALQAYQDVVDALRNLGRRNSFSRYLHFLEKLYLIFLQFSYTGFFSMLKMAPMANRRQVSF